MYWEQIKVSVRTLLVLSVLTGVLYPVAMTGISQVLFRYQANGSLILRNGKPAGSQWIGQAFDDPKYFWGRPSSTSLFPFNASNSSGSNLGPLNSELLRAVQDRVASLRKVDQGNRDPIPVDLVTSSSSGLDPHITPAAARYQLKRVAKFRGLSESAVGKLIDQFTEGRLFGVLGEPRVSVLELNLALDQEFHGSAT